MLQMKKRVEREQETGQGHTAGRCKKDLHQGLLSFSVERVLSMVVHKMSQETAQASLYCLVSVADLWFKNAWPKFLKRKPNSSLQSVWEALKSWVEPSS